MQTQCTSDCSVGRIATTRPDGFYVDVQIGLDWIALALAFRHPVNRSFQPMRSSHKNLYTAMDGLSFNLSFYAFANIGPGQKLLTF